MDRLAQRWECTTTGVSPLRPQVERIDGRSLSPDSSAKMISFR
jgi:hypothetical protein